MKEKNTYPFTREELIEIKERALIASGRVHMNSSWERAYVVFADAADHLDAILARTEVQE